MPPETALITGGSSGIGCELAKLFAADGYRLAIVALGQDELDQAQAYLRETYDVQVVAWEQDLAEPGGPRAVYERVRSMGWELDALVNCAGFGMHGACEALDVDRLARMVQVNCIALMTLTRLAYADMRARNRGRILNMSSTVGLQPVVDMAAYAATKAFVDTFSLGLSAEARYAGGQVTVTTVYPYATRTNFRHVAGMAEHRLFRNPFTLTPERVARQAYGAMQRGAHRVILPRWGSVVWDLLYRLMPIRARIALVKWGMRT